MTDEELIARLRAVDVSWSQVGEDCAAAADRIELLATTCEQLVATNEAQAREAALREAASVILNDFDALLKVAGKATEAHNSGLSLTEGVRQGLRALIGEART